MPLGMFRCEFFLLFPAFKRLDLLVERTRFVIAWICCGIGAIGMVWLWWRWRYNYIWILNRIFLCVVVFAHPSPFLMTVLHQLDRAYSTPSQA